jgi:hypothetical protein
VPSLVFTEPSFTNSERFFWGKFLCVVVMQVVISFYNVCGEAADL